MSTNFSATTPVPSIPPTTLYLDFSKLYLRRLSDDELTIIDTSKKTITYPICSLLMRRNSSLYRNWQEQGNKPVHFIIASSHNAIETVIQICHHSGYVDFLAASGTLSEAELVLINIVGDLFGVEGWATISARIAELSRPNLSSHSTGAIGRGGTVGKAQGEARANILSSREDEAATTPNTSQKAAQNRLKLKEIKKRQTMKFDLSMLDHLNESDPETDRAVARKSNPKIGGGLVNSPSSSSVPTATNATAKDASATASAQLASNASSNALSLQGLDAAELIANGYLEMNTIETQALIERLNRIYPALVDSLVRQAQSQLASFVSQQASSRSGQRSLGSSGKVSKGARVSSISSGGGGSETVSLDDELSAAGFPTVTATANLSEMLAECERKEAELQRERRKLLREQQELSAQADRQHSPNASSSQGNQKAGGTISAPVKREKEKASSIFQHFPSKESTAAKNASSDSAASKSQQSLSSYDASVSSAGSASGSNAKKTSSVPSLSGEKRDSSVKSPRVGFKGFQPKDKRSGRDNVPPLVIPANMPQVPVIPVPLAEPIAEPAEPDLYHEQGDYNLSFFMTFGAQKHVYGSNPATFAQLRAQIRQIFKISAPVDQIRVCYLNEYGESVPTDSLDALIDANELEISILS